MAKKSKITTPDWVLKGEKPPAKKKAEKTFKMRECPKCKSDNVVVVLTGEEGSAEDEPLATSSASSQSKGKGEWECRKCSWKGQDVAEKEITEDEFLKRAGE